MLMGEGVIQFRIAAFSAKDTAHPGALDSPWPELYGVMYALGGCDELIT